MKTQYGKIKKKFFKHGEEKPLTANTVGELKLLLNQLPDDLPIISSFSTETTVQVYNITTEPVLIFGEW